jgi:hypothetical protein
VTEAPKVGWSQDQTKRGIEPVTTLQAHQETSARAENIHKAESGAKIHKVLCLKLQHIPQNSLILARILQIPVERQTPSNSSSEARLGVAVSDEDFRKWLRMPNELLDDRKPIDLIAEGKWQVVADLVADIISGNPT